ncbi:hypothetical protein JXA02_00530 [candidate division KSB1 bacterium]|nr:hypothetical protein [candidate division KSB1 bacterium]RQW11446.1 MAG: hypothetical protein EH222_00560 [candidate division KSB1 bacterium]
MRMRLSIICLTAGLFLLQGVHGQELESSAACADCHVQAVIEWQTSRHALSTAATNPFYAAMLRWAAAVDDEAQDKCDVCHVPVKSLASTAEMARQLEDEGVTCDVCHATQPHGKWLRLHTAGVKLGPSHDAVSVVHASQFSEHLVSSRQCLTCHANLESAHGFAFCSTQKEYLASSFSKKGVTCQDCHMPAMEGKTAELGKIRQVHSHRFYGGYNPEILLNCAALELVVSREETQLALAVKVKNRTVGHALPTGSPMRAVYLSLKALDRDGTLIWQNYQSNPLLEDPDAVFMRLLEDEAGRAPAPPWLASRVRFDQRLQPDEVRELSYDIPAANVATISAVLQYRLAPPAILQKLNLYDESLSTIVTIAAARYDLE